MTLWNRKGAPQGLCECVSPHRLPVTSVWDESWGSSPPRAHDTRSRPGGVRDLSMVAVLPEGSWVRTEGRDDGEERTQPWCVVCLLSAPPTWSIPGLIL